MYPPSLGEFASRMLNPGVRFTCRYFAALRPFLWDRIICPKLAWRDYGYVAKSGFGYTFAGTTADVIQRYIYYFGIWEPYVSGFIGKRLKPGDVVIDIGANIGYMSLLAASKIGPQGRVIAIEASSRTFRKLQANVARNKASNVRPVWGAVSDVTGELKLFHGPDSNTGLSSLVRDFGEYSEVVHAAPLEHWLTEQDIREARLIKIDVEGAEMQVLRSMVPLLPKLREDVEIVCEVSPEMVPEEEFKATIAHFTRHGFELYELPDDVIANYLRPSFVHPAAERIRGRFERRTEIVFSRADVDRL